MLRRKGEGRRHNQLTNAAACGLVRCIKWVAMHERGLRFKKFCASVNYLTLGCEKICESWRRNAT
jgi:hypothetical protein